MSNTDLRDVLNLPDSAASQRPSKKQRLSVPRPSLKGLAREVYSLGGDNPIAIVPEVTQFKKRRFASRKPAAKWMLKPFTNSARRDESLVLHHWRRKEDRKAANPQSEEGDPDQQHLHQNEEKSAEEEPEDSAFAKYSVQISVPQYSHDQYHQSLTSETWSKGETDYLMGLVADFELRWPLIWDRYEWNPPATNGDSNDDGDESKAVVPAIQSRTMEDLKARYYEVAAKMMALQKPVQYMTQPEFALHELMTHFNPQQEKLRKDFARNCLTRSREEAREEESLLVEIKRMKARNDRLNEERKELYSRLDYPRSETDINQFKTSAGLQSLLQNLMTADKSKKRKVLLGPEGANSPANPPVQQPAPQEASRRESVAASTSNRDSTAAPTPTTSNNKKGAQQQQQQSTERPKLTEKEEIIYGVTHHERLPSGPTFRTERINKTFSHKSQQQQLRITNTLNELDVPNKLVMPTASTTTQYELLLQAVIGLLDARKVSDKLDGEIKIEQNKKDEREKANVPEPSNNNDAKGTAAVEDIAASGNGDQGSAKSGQADGDEASLEADEAHGEQAHPESNGASDNKRSASVLSSASDKSTKRQKR